MFRRLRKDRVYYLVFFIVFLSFWPKNISKSNKDSFDFRSLYFKVSAVAKVCRRIMWGAGGEDCTNFARLFIRTMRCFIFSVKTILVKNRSGLGFGGGQWQLYISQQKTNILFCGQYISSQMTSEGSLLIFLFFFSSWFVTSSKAMYMRSVGLGIGLSFFRLG